MKPGRDYKCRRYRNCGQRFASRPERAMHEDVAHNSKRPPKKRSEREAGDAALKNSELYKKRQEPGPKEIKVMIPPSYHKKLHGVKLLSGKTITVLVNEALDRYFRDQQKEREEQ